MTEIEEQMMKRACDLATLNVERGSGCVITDAEDNVLAEGHNQVTQTNDPTAHAEIVAIRKACKLLETYDLSTCKLYSSCEPCQMCLSAIYWARIKHVSYGNTGTNDKNIEFDDDVSERNAQTRKKIDSSLESFDLWSNKKDKLFY